MADVPFILPAHNLLVSGERLYVAWYKAGLQGFDFDSTGFVGRPIYHQAQTEPTDGASEGAWGVRLAAIDTDTYVFQSDRRYGLIVDRVDFCSSLANPGQPNADGDGVINACDLDDDNDGWTDVAELFIGTDPLNSGTPGGWPPDPAPEPNGNCAVQIDDVTLAASAFGSTTTPRAEIATQNGIVQIDDVTQFASRFGDTC